MPSQIDVANGIDSADDPAVDPAADDPPIINHPTPSKTKSITIDILILTIKMTMMLYHHCLVHLIMVMPNYLALNPVSIDGDDVLKQCNNVWDKYPVVKDILKDAPAPSLATPTPTKTTPMDEQFIKNFMANLWEEKLSAARENNDDSLLNYDSKKPESLAELLPPTNSAEFRARLDVATYESISDKESLTNDRFDRGWRW